MIQKLSLATSTSTSTSTAAAAAASRQKNDLSTPHALCASLASSQMKSFGKTRLCICLLSILLFFRPSPTAAAAAAAAFAVSSSGAVVAIESTGAITMISESKYSTGPSCAFDASSQTFFSLQRAVSSASPLSASPPSAAAHARLVGVHVPSGVTSYDDELPFDASNATSFAG